MKASEVASLFRLPESMLIGGSGILTLVFIEIANLIQITLLFLVLSLGAMGIFSWNDSLDIKEDKIAHPERPIISGKITVLEARTLGSFLLLISLLLSLLLSIQLVFLGALGIFIGIAYSFTSKAQFILIAPMKNLVVSGTTGLFMIIIPFIFDKRINFGYIIFVTTFVMLLFGYEILKDIRDVEGDTRAGYQTLPTLKGINFSTGIAVFFFVISCTLISLMFFLIEYLAEAWISLFTSIIILLPFYPLYKNPVPLQSDTTRYGVITILLIALTSITLLLYLRLI